MRSALLCVLFALAVGKGGRQAGAANDFTPQPIPLNNWNVEFREGRVGTLHEAAHTAAPPSVAAVPAHYWEDALRHSVYLTLVRDKIDQLISKGAVISPDSKPDQFNSKEVEDYDLWDKIKTAPFDRLSDKELNTFGDVTVMAKGRLLEENSGFRFTEDERTNEKCNEESCMKGVRAIWSVKRVRQRDEEVSPGKYHYELTFSVMSQTTKKQRKPYENSVRTFTVRENPQDAGRPVEKPKPHGYEPVRYQRAIWFHKNLVPSGTQSRRYQGLDRIFMSLFSDDEPKQEPPRARPPAYTPYQQPQKSHYVSSSTEQYQQKKLLAFPYKPPLYKYARYPLPPPVVVPQQHFVDPSDSTFVVSAHRHVAPSNIYKTTRPAVLPTPLVDIETSTKDINDTETSTRETEAETTAYKMYSKPQPSPTKINYLPDHIRPPVYNAPPGVFVTMDKKPFKPLPPVRLQPYPAKHKLRPADFRPSPQLLDMQFSDPESHSTVDTAFRPIIPNNNKTSPYNSGSNKKSQTTNKRPPKKHGNIKAKPVTTSAPDIITVYKDDSYDDTPEWSSIVSSFAAVTAPIRPSTVTSTEDTQVTEETETDTLASETDEYEIDTTTATPITYNHNKKKRVITTSTAEPSTTTSQRPNRRTRPPISFPKQEKIKKHKRITTTTNKPVKQNNKINPTADLTPQASSAATKPTNKVWESKNKTVSVTESNNIITTVSNTTPSTTTARATTTTTTTTAKPIPTTTHSTHKPTQPKSKNRFRQSTLMQKGTSVNHDKWSSINIEKEKNKTVVPPSGFPPRRKASNFQGHVTSTHRSIDVDHKEEDHTDKKSSAEYMSAEKFENSSKETHEKGDHQYNVSNRDEDIGESKGNIKESEGYATDEKEFIFGLSTQTPNERTNEINDAEDPITEETIITTQHSVPKNKTKCKKKKKAENLMSSDEHVAETTTAKYGPTTTIPPTTTTDLYHDLFGDINYDGTIEKNKKGKGELDEEGSEKHEKYAQIDDDLYDYLDELNNNKHKGEDEDQYEEEDEGEAPIDLSPFNSENETSAAREVRKAEDDEEEAYDDYQDRSPSFLELIGME